MTIILDDTIAEKPEFSKKLYDEYWLGMRTDEAPGTMHIDLDGVNGMYCSG